MRRAGAPLVLALALTALAGAGRAQEATGPGAPLAAPAPPADLPDLRAGLAALAAEIADLRASLKAAGRPAFAAAGGASAIDRMNAIEAEIARLTGIAEALGARIDRVVADGTRRVQDLEFRLCEIDPACDLGALMTEPMLGLPAGPGAAGPVIAPPGTGPAPGPADARLLTAAQAQIDTGALAEAAAALAPLAAGEGPLAAAAGHWRGVALERAGRHPEAAAAWLTAFAADPDAPEAAATLLGLARLTADPGAACAALDEALARNPGPAEAAEAAAQGAARGCVPPDPEADGADPEAAADAAAGADG